MSASNAATLLNNSYRRKLVWSAPDVDRDALLQETIDGIYSLRTDEERADLYSRLKEAGFTANAGMTTRKIIATRELRAWNSARARGTITKKVIEETAKTFSLEAKA